MHKPELIQHLRDFSKSPENQWKGQDIFAEYFASWLEGKNIPADEKYHFYDLVPYLPQLAIDAFEDLRLGTDDVSTKFRNQWKASLEQEVPNVTDVGASPILEQGHASQTVLSFMLTDVVARERGKENSVFFQSRMESYANAQRLVVQQLFDKFLRQVYQKGMFELIDQCSNRYMSGQFNGTELRTGVLAGRVMFTFARRIDPDKPGIYEENGRLICNEHNLSFVAGDDDPLALSAGIQTLWADLRTCMDMIDDVVTHWPKDREGREAVFTPSENVGFL